MVEAGDEVFFCDLDWAHPGVRRGIAAGRVGLGADVEVLAGGKRLRVPAFRVVPAEGIPHLTACETCGVWCFPALHGNGHLHLEAAPDSSGDWALAPETDSGVYVALVVPTFYGQPGKPTYRRHVCSDRFGPLSQSPAAR
jgi:hypothetical protein